MDVEENYAFTFQLLQFQRRVLYRCNLFLNVLSSLVIGLTPSLPAM